MSPEISIVIASHRPALLTGLLDSLSRQDFGADRFETVVVTDYDPGAFAEKYRMINWRFLDNRSISAKRNLGVSLSKGEILAFVDDDCIPASDWLSKGASYLAGHKDASAVEGLTTIEEIGKLTGAHREYKRLERPGFRTNNIFFRREAFLAVGGFDERFTVQREDVDLAFSVKKMGGKIDYCPQIRVEHRFRYWERWDLLKNCWNRRFDPLLYRKHPELYRKHIHSPFPPGILLISAGYLFLSFSFPANNRTVSKWAAVLNLALVLVFGIKRCGIGKESLKKFVSETVSVILSPLVLTGALIYGSIRFRKFLLI
ncbi:MAG: glycosyltransferase [Fibrobacter sp.]|jgi:GT2 family glycosyltransferase|nr:glycosyltransferase [Fibrobacter sp.]